MKRGVTALLITIAALIALAGIAILAAVVVLRTRWFEEKVRATVIEEVNRTTGGRTELGEFHFDSKTLTARVSQFVLHGTEPPNEDPLVRADSVILGLRIISILDRKIDLASLVIEHPRVNVLVDANNHTNFPEPKVKQAVDDPIQTILKLKIQKLAIVNGLVRINEFAVPLELRAENLQASFDFDPKKPRYFGNVSMRKFHLESGKNLSLPLDIDATLALERGLIHVSESRIAMDKTVLNASGTVHNILHPVVDFDVKATGDITELNKPLDLPRNFTQAGRGKVMFDGKITYSAADDYLVAGRVEGTGIDFRGDDFDIPNINAKGILRLDKHEITVQNVTARALGGLFQGSALIRDFSKFSAKGRISNITLSDVAEIAKTKHPDWSGTIAGPVELKTTLSDKVKDLTASGQFTILPGNTGIPIEGVLQIAYDQHNQKINLGDSVLRTAASSARFHGTFGERLDFKLESTDLRDFIPALALASGHPELPVKLAAGGHGSFNGFVTGQLTEPQVSGDLTLTKFEAANENIDDLTATLTAAHDKLHVKTFTIHQGSLQLEGGGDLALQGWKALDNSAISASLRVQGAEIGKLIEKYGNQKLPVDGVASGTAAVAGTLNDPQIKLQALVEKVKLYGETFDHFRGGINYGQTGIEVVHGELDHGKSTILVSATFQHPADDWKNGHVTFDLATAQFTLPELKYVQDMPQKLQGVFDLKATGAATIQKGEPVLNNLNGHLSLRNFIVDSRQFGTVNLEAKSTGPELHLALAGDIAGAKLTGTGDFQLTGDCLGKGHAEITPVKLAALQDFLKPASKERYPFDGEIVANATFSGPLLKPDLMKAHVEIPRVEVAPTKMPDTSGKQAKDLRVKNSAPIVFEADINGIRIQSAQIVGLDTRLDATGVFSFRDAKRPWDIHIAGNANLAILQDFQVGLTSSGSAVVDANIRGNFEKPQISGRMELKTASFSMADLPNGIDQATGLVIFDQNRATIVDRLTAQTGGGEIALTGFVGYGSGTVVYRLQGSASVVRVRVEGVSLTANARLTLTGTSERSILAGSITALKAAFNPKTDIGSLLLASAGPVAAPAAPSEFLRGMQLDIHIGNAPNFQFQTTLSNNLQAEMDLRLQGNAGRPVILGHITVNQGDITFFGNKYTINRGEVGFYNTIKIEPVLDLDLETQAGGVTVDLTLAGTLSKLNMSYRSDPPLQSNEIIALLTVGRSPTSNSQLAASQTVAPERSLTSSTNSLLGQAISSPVSSRLQRFFGVSRLKIDPLLTGVNAVPQARLTIEQQISKDITLTYVTNLTQANDQLVKFEWHLNRQWSIVAIREENGIFGIDFFYKKRFK